MKQSLNLGRIAGIRILIHWTFFLLIGWIVFREVRNGSNTPTILANVGFILAIFTCVVLHELGHSLTAKQFGINTRKITLLPIGGVASLERIPEDPKQELWVSLAGPAVNVVIALLLLPIIRPGNMDSQEMLSNLASVDGFLTRLFWVNISLVIFNLIPAFPMDGGRILRALLALRMNRRQATQIAAGLGQLLAFGFVLFGLFYNPLLVLVGIFVYFGAQSENVVVQNLEVLEGHTVREAMMTNIITLHPEETIKDAADKLLAGFDQDLIVVENEQAIGLMSRPLIINALKENLAQIPVRQVMQREFDQFDINDKLANAFTFFQKRGRAFYPVIENNKLRGAIDLTNIQEFVMIRSAMS